MKRKTLSPVWALALFLGGSAACSLAVKGSEPPAARTAAVQTPAANKPPKPSRIPGVTSGGALPTPEPDELLLDTDAEPLYGDAPLTVRFSAEPFDPEEATNPQYIWEFGDGSPPSTEQFPVHTYDRPGDYTASVRITEAGGKSGSEEFDLSVYPAEE